ncbi:NAD(P)-dependent oxidoreductase [Amylibacter sp. SFDW26]|uniref:NAD(P)-dependent oxidoreductase n=1 Tax=Amylibacter sp. SFDW26 TaxID=2652722 RepID=UPI001D014AFC|nr:NAD(P)-binding domain-containing protein [Amylibacter sp. SFDW26]
MMANLKGIGIAGCGRMGEPMLQALINAGFDALGYDVRPCESYTEIAPFMTNDIAVFSDRLETLITVVRDTDQTDDVLFGAQSFTKAPNLETIIICSTLSPRYVRDLRNRVPEHITLIDAPMSGARIAAEEAQLSFMLGGKKDGLDSIQPLLSAMGAHFHHMGEYGSGMSAKVLNNMLAASNTAMTRLVLDWADQQSIDERKLLDLIATSSGQNWLASGMETIEFARDGYSLDNTIGIIEKDVKSALDDAPDNADTALPEAVIEAIRGLKPRS